MFKVLKVLIGISLLFKCALASEKNRILGVGLGGGVNSAFGNGFELALFPGYIIEIDSGVGVDYSGIKYGMGLKANLFEFQNYFLKNVQEIISVRVSVSHNNGGEVTLKSKGSDVKYKVLSHETINGSLGYGYVFSNLISSTLNIGYMKRLNNRTPLLLSGLETPSTKKDVNDVPANGLELSLGIMLLL